MSLGSLPLLYRNVSLAVSHLSQKGHGPDAYSSQLQHEARRVPTPPTPHRSTLLPPDPVTPASFACFTLPRAPVPNSHVSFNLISNGTFFPRKSPLPSPDPQPQLHSVRCVYTPMSLQRGPAHLRVISRPFSGPPGAEMNE